MDIDDISKQIVELNDNLYDAHIHSAIEPETFNILDYPEEYREYVELYTTGKYMNNNAMVMMTYLSNHGYLSEEVVML